MRNEKYRKNKLYFRSDILMKGRNISLMFLPGLTRGEVYRISLVPVDFYLILFLRICVFNI